MKAHVGEKTQISLLVRSQLWQKRNYSDEDYNNDVVGLISARSGPGCLGPQTCMNVCVSVQEPIRNRKRTGFHVYRRTDSCAGEHTCAHTHICRCACFANELPNSAPEMLMKVSASLRGKHDRSRTPKVLICGEGN